MLKLLVYVSLIYKKRSSMICIYMYKIFIYKNQRAPSANKSELRSFLRQARTARQAVPPVVAYSVSANSNLSTCT